MTVKMNDPKHLKMLVRTAKERMMSRAKTWLNDPIVRKSLENRAIKHQKG